MFSFPIARYGAVSAVVVSALLASTSVIARTADEMAAGEAASETSAAEPASAEHDMDTGSIVVTARKREETLIDIPLSIQAFTAEDLQDKGVQGLQDLSRFTPSLFFVNSTVGQGQRTISEVRFRGLSTANGSVVNQYGSVFEDGIYLMNGAQSLGFSDVERIEVVKGPQSAYFGRATFAGAVNFITRDPAKELRADMMVSYSPSFGSYDLGGSIEGPLIGDVLSGRISFQTKKKGAQYTASDGGSLGEERTDTVNFGLLFTPTDKLRIKLRGTYGENHDGAAFSTYYGFSDKGNCPIGTPVTVNTTTGTRNVTLARRFQCGDIPFNAGVIDRNTAMITLPAAGPAAPALNIGDILVRNSLNDPLLRDAPKLDHFGLAAEFLRISGSLDYEISDQFSLTVAGGYAKQDINAIWDTDGTPNPSGFAAIPLFSNNHSIEGRLRYDNGSWLSASVGANYFRANYRGSQDTGTAIVNLNQVGTGVARAFQSAVTNSNEKLKTVGFFFGVDVKPLDWITLTAEGRYQIDDDTKFAGSNALNTLVRQNVRSKDFTPRFIVSLNPFPRSTLYASYSVGVLPGTANTNFVALSAANQAIVRAQLPDIPIFLASEELKNYEIGFKTALPEIGLNFSLAAFRMDWANLKTSTTVIVPTFANPVFGVQIPGTARITGFEFEGRLAVTDNFSLQASGGYLKTKLRQYTNTSYNAFFTGLPAGTTFSAIGNRLPRTPDWTGSGSAIWTAPLTDDWEYTLRGDVFYTGRQYTDETNITSVSDYVLANASVEFSKSDDMSIRLWVNNLFDKRAWLTGRRFVDVSGIPLNFATAGQGAYVTPSDKREIGVTMRKRF
jgi:iron complex outermembrane receptor protein